MSRAQFARRVAKAKAENTESNQPTKQARTGARSHLAFDPSHHTLSAQHSMPRKSLAADADDDGKGADGILSYELPKSTGE